MIVYYWYTLIYMDLIANCLIYLRLHSFYIYLNIKCVICLFTSSIVYIV